MVRPHPPNTSRRPIAPDHLAPAPSLPQIPKVPCLLPLSQPHLPGHPPAAPSPEGPKSSRRSQWVAHFTEVWGRGTSQSSRANLKRSGRHPPTSPSAVSTSGKLTPTSIHRPYSPPVHSPGTSRPLSVMLAEKPREEGQGQPWGETIHSSLSFIPGGTGPRSGHGLGQPQRDEEELAKDQTPEKAWSGCGASCGEPGPQDNSRGQGVQRPAGLRGAGMNRGPTAGAEKAGRTRTLGSTSRGPPCLLPPEAPSPSVPSRRPWWGDWPSIPYLRWHPTQRGDVSAPSSVADSWHMSLKRPDGSWGVDHPQRERARGDLQTRGRVCVFSSAHTPGPVRFACAGAHRFRSCCATNVSAWAHVGGMSVVWWGVCPRWAWVWVWCVHLPSACIHGCKASPSGPPCDLAQPNTHRPSGCSQTFPGPQSPGNPQRTRATLPAPAHLHFLCQEPLPPQNPHPGSDPGLQAQK